MRFNDNKNGDNDIHNDDDDNSDDDDGDGDDESILIFGQTKSTREKQN